MDRAIREKRLQFTPAEKLVRAIFGEGLSCEHFLSTEGEAVVGQLLDELLQQHKGREAVVLGLRFGFIPLTDLEERKRRSRPSNVLSNTARTLEEVAVHFGVTRERIRQIEAKGLRMLRHPSRSRRLKDYLGE